MSDESLDPPDDGAPQQDALFNVDPDWSDLWQGMPEYSHEDLQPWQSIYVHFQTPRDREAFAELVGQQIHERTKFIWYPKAEIRRASDKVWTSSGKRVIPRHPVYIISKGRWESRLTSKALEWIGVPYHIVVEPQEHDQYAAVIDPAKILVLPFSNLGQGGIPARNWVWAHSIAAGAERHWILDDNISGFCRFQDNLKVEVDSGATFCAIEDWVDRYENVAMAAFNYDYFAPRKQGTKIKPITLNTRCYSGILLSNTLTPHRWRGRYNEDTDLSLRILKDGLCTALFNAFLMYKKPTLTMKGGNTDELYKGVEAMAVDWEAHVAECKQCKQCVDGYPTEAASRAAPCSVGRTILSKDGRWLMAESLREQHSDCVTVERKWRRWQHQVDYRRFNPDLGRNTLRLRSDVVISEDADDYGMTFDAMPKGWGAMGHDARASAMGAAAAPQATSALDFVRGLAKQVLSGSRQPGPATDQPDQGEATEPEVELPPASPQPFPMAPQPIPADPETGSLASQLNHRQPTVGTSETLFEEPQTLARFLGSERPRIDTHYVPVEPPDLTGIDEIVLNFATDGLDWAHGHRPIGVTVSTLDGKLTRFLPFAFAGGNLDEAVVKRWAQEQLCCKKIYNANTRFDLHMSREWSVNLEEQFCLFSDIMHTAALLDDHRKRFALDVLAEDYLPGQPVVARVDEARMTSYHASEVVERERFTAQLVARLRDVMYPQIEEQDLRRVQDLEDRVIPAVVEMEKNGAPIDMALLEQYSVECNKRHDALLWEISREVGFAFDHKPKSWQHLFEKLGLPPTDGIAEAVIEAIDHPIVKKAHLAAQYASLNSKTFKAYKEQIGADGILRFDINQLRGDEGGTVSGRFSIGYVQQVPNHDNHFKVFGDDLFPRRLFIPASESYLEADARQIEYRIFAHLANNPKVLAAYQKDPMLSFHEMTWEMMKAYKPDMLYSHQKRFNFAKQYGARSIKLASMMDFITEEEGREIRGVKNWNDPRLNLIHEIEAAYKQMMPEGDALLDRASHLAKPACDEFCKRGDALHRQLPHRGYVKTLLGRRSRFPTNHKTYIGLNRVIQGTAADEMKMKLVELHDARKQTGFIMRITVHDAVGGDATMPETKGRVAEILDKQSLPLKVPILWSVNTGANWAECK